MNITHFVENLDRGGLERMVLELAKLQQQQGHHCQVVCLYEAGSLAHELDASGIPVRACQKREGVDFRALLRARRAVRAHATEVLHTHNAVAHYQGVLATRGLGIRYVINTRHGMGGNQPPGRREWLFRRAMNATDKVVAVCEAARRDAVRRGLVPAEKAAVVPNGIRLSAFQSGTNAMHEHIVQMLKLPEHTQVIGTVGRLNWAKDQVNLIRAFARVHASRPDTALLLIGEGELRQTLHDCAISEGVADHVYFLGDRNDVHSLLQGLDLFVLSSLSEGYSMALLEACATGLPIVATDVGGNGEIIRDGDNGRLVPAEDSDALATAMLALLREPAHALAQGNAARAWVESHGSLETMAARYTQLYLAATD